MKRVLVIWLLFALVPVCADEWADGVPGAAPEPVNPNVEFLVTLYRGNRQQNQMSIGTNRDTQTHRRQDTETIRVANGDTAFVGSSQQIPVNIITSGYAQKKNQTVDNTAKANAVGSVQLNQTSLSQNQAQLSAIQSVLDNISQNANPSVVAGGGALSLDIQQSIQNLNLPTAMPATLAAAQSLLLSQRSLVAATIKTQQQNEAQSQGVYENLNNNPNTGQLEDTMSGTKVVEYKTVESGVQVKPKLMGRFVQLELVIKDEHYDAQTKAINTQNSRHVVTVPLGEWSQVTGNQDSDEENTDVYSTSRDQDPAELWVKVERVP